MNSRLFFALLAFPIFAALTATASAPEEDSLRSVRRDGFYELSVPPHGRIVLKIPSDGLQPQTDRAGGATDSPRYFSFSDPDRGLTISGWFESAEGYSDVKSFWKKEAAAMRANGGPAPANVQFEKLEEWDVVTYEVSLPPKVVPHLRAELVRRGTWIDVHLSLIGNRPVADLRRELKAFLLSLAIESP